MRGATRLVMQRWWLGMLVAAMIIAVLAEPKAQPAPPGGDDALMLSADAALGAAMLGCVRRGSQRGPESAHGESDVSPVRGPPAFSSVELKPKVDRRLPLTESSSRAWHEAPTAGGCTSCVVSLPALTSRPGRSAWCWWRWRR